MFFSVTVSCIIFAAIICFAARIVSEAGFSLPQNKVTAFLTADKAPARPDEASQKYEYLKIFLFALAIRFIVFLGGWIAAGIFSDDTPMSLLDYCGRWNIWDSPHYLDVAEHGYSYYEEGGQHLFLVFFPLYPFITKIFAFIFRNYVISGLIVSFLSYSLGCVLMYKLVNIDYSREIARKSVLFISISPFSFFFGGIMTESVFFLFIAAAFLAIRKHNWLWAGILGALAALSRSFGVFMIVVAAVEWVQHERPIALIKEKKTGELGKKFISVLPILIIPVGTLIYLLINYLVDGNALVFTQYQREHWSMTLQYFGKTIRLLTERSFNPNESWSLVNSLFLCGLISSIAASVIILLGVRRTRSSYTLFMLIYFFFNAGPAWPLSLSRYMTCLLPAFWVLAALTEKHKHIDSLVTAAMAIGLGIYLTGYITMHQIM